MLEEIRPRRGIEALVLGMLRAIFVTMSYGSGRTLESISKNSPRSAT